jgi:hypothetical protein
VYALKSHHSMPRFPYRIATRSNPAAISLLGEYDHPPPPNFRSLSRGVTCRRPGGPGTRSHHQGVGMDQGFAACQLPNNQFNIFWPGYITAGTISLTANNILSHLPSQNLSNRSFLFLMFHFDVLVISSRPSVCPSHQPVFDLIDPASFVSSASGTPSRTETN